MIYHDVIVSIAKSLWKEKVYIDIKKYVNLKVCFMKKINLCESLHKEFLKTSVK